MSRPGFDEWFLGIAEAVSARADCTRSKVGAVIARDHELIQPGYNGAPPGMPGCLSAGACIAVHAEANAIIRAGRDRCQGATIYVTRKPCDGCMRLILAAGIVRIIWPGMPADLM